MRTHLKILTIFTLLLCFFNASIQAIFHTDTQTDPPFPKKVEKKIQTTKKKLSKPKIIYFSITDALKEIEAFCIQISEQHAFTLTMQDYNALIEKSKELIRKNSIDEKISNKNMEKIKKALEDSLKNYFLIFYPPKKNSPSKTTPKFQPPSSKAKSMQTRSKQRRTKITSKKTSQRKYEQAVSLTFASQKVSSLLKNNNLLTNLNNSEIREIHKNIMRKLLHNTTPRNRILPSIIQKITADEIALYKEAKQELRPTKSTTRSDRSRLLRRKRSLPRSVGF